MKENCRACNKEYNKEDKRICPTCGNTVCAECYDKNGGVCEKCADNLVYIQ